MLRIDEAFVHTQHPRGRTSPVPGLKSRKPSREFNNIEKLYFKMKFHHRFSPPTDQAGPRRKKNLNAKAQPVVIKQNSSNSKYIIPNANHQNNKTCKIYGYTLYIYYYTTQLRVTFASPDAPKKSIKFAPIVRFQSHPVITCQVAVATQSQ
jgi:hypothetical protein